MYTYRYRHPVYGGAAMVLDCYALCAPLALKKAQRWIAAENFRLHQAGVPGRIRVPTRAHQLSYVRARWP